MKKLTETATQTVELVARVGRLVQELKALAEDAGLSGDEITGPAEDMPEAVSRRISGRLSAVETQCDDLSTQCGTIETDLAALGEEVGSRYHGLNTLINSAGHSILKVGNNIALRNKDSNIISTASDIASASDVTALKERVTALEGRADKAESDLCDMVRMIAKLHPDSLSAVLETYPRAAHILSRQLPPEEFAELFPDVVAVCEPDESYFAWSKYTGNNNDSPCSAVVRTTDGILYKADCPTGANTDVISIASADRVTFLNLKGYKRFYINNIWVDETTVVPEGAPTTAEELIPLRHLSGVAHMEDLGSQNFITQKRSNNYSEDLEIYGDWSGAVNAKWATAFGTWGGVSKITHLPSALNKSAFFGAAFLSCGKVERFPDLDFINATGDHANTFGALDDNRGVPYPDKVYLRISNFGAHPIKHMSFNVLKNWDIDDMRYTLIEASLKSSEKITTQIHPSAYARLTVADRAQCAAKNFTLVSCTTV